MSAPGGLPQPLTVPIYNDGELIHTRPSILPGGGGLLFTINSGPLSAPRIAVYSFASGEHTSLVEGSSPRYVSTGHVIFGQAGSLWAVPFDLEQLALTGEPTPLIEDVQVTQGTAALVSFSIADDGTLVYGPSTFVELRSLVWVDRNGTEEPLVGARPDE